MNALATERARLDRARLGVLRKVLGFPEPAIGGDS
jgi:hypothetical protein